MTKRHQVNGYDKASLDYLAMRYDAVFEKDFDQKQGYNTWNAGC